jgi:GNAT superfamily N-acetyltransferase
MNSSLREFAEAPDAYLAPAPGVRIVDGERFYATLSGDGRWISVCRLGFAPEAASSVLAEIRALRPGAQTSWQTPDAKLAGALRAAGCRAPDPPLQPLFTALATDREPPKAEEIEVRSIDTFDDHVIGLEIDLASSMFTEEGAARRRAEAGKSYARRRARPGGQWLAYLDGRPVAWAGAVAGARGLYLSGGATLPEARGRGCYRALVRARWDHAVALGTPALAVGAQETSRPILERCSFERVCTMYELETDA